MSTRLTTSQFAQVAGIDQRSARQAFARASQGKPWRGVLLAIEQLHGRGGAGGWSYVVRASSLPTDLQARLKPLPDPAAEPPQGLSPKANWWLSVLSPARAHPPNSRARGAATAAIVEHTRTRWDGAPIALSVRDVQRKLAALERNGIVGIVPKVRADKGVRRVLISKAWFDAVAPLFDAATIERIDTALRTYVRTMLAAGESPKRTIFRAGMKLKELTAAAGYKPEGGTARRTFAVPRRYIDDQRLSRKVAMRDRDAKAWHDRRPAMIRKPAARPTEFDMDAMHFDHIVCRDDGTPAYPKAIVSMCRATHRLRVDVFLLDAREGIRQEHVADHVERTFAAWGVPERLTIDNGGEFRAVSDLADIMQLVSQVHSTDGRRPIVNAQPYNARAKVVENGIGVLQRCWLSSLPGHVGNNRINRKTQQVGRPTAPFTGNFALFAEVVQARVREYNAALQNGRLKGRSPDEAYRAHIEAGFTIATIDPASLLLAFSTREKRVIHPRGIEVGKGRWWSCPELHYRSGETIGILKGRFRNWPVVPLFDLADEKTIIGYAEPHDAVDGNNPANAKEAGRRIARFNARAKEIAAAAPPADLVADTIASAAALPPFVVAPVGGTVIPNPQAAEIVAAMAEDADTREQRRRAKASRDAKKQLAVFEKFAPKKVVGR